MEDKKVLWQYNYWASVSEPHTSEPHTSAFNVEFCPYGIAVVVWWYVCLVQLAASHLYCTPLLPPSASIVLPHSMLGHIRYWVKAAYVFVNFVIIITGAPPHACTVASKLVKCEH